jgi:hypothetical protein
VRSDRKGFFYAELGWAQMVCARLPAGDKRNHFFNRARTCDFYGSFTLSTSQIDDGWVQH